jgi:hypothetical protein
MTRIYFMAWPSLPGVADFLKLKKGGISGMAVFWAKVRVAGRVNWRISGGNRPMDAL